MKLDGKKVIALGERDGVPGPAIAECMRSAGAEPIFVETECFVCTAAGAMDPENQDRIKSLVDEHGADDVVVVLGAADLEALEVAAETLTVGDPAYVGSLAGVQLGLPVVHILEEDVKEQVDPEVYDEQVGLLEMTLDVDQVRRAAEKFPGRNGG